MEEKNKSGGMEEEIEFEQKGKIKSKKVLYDNITFDSKLEVSIYKFLKKENIIFKYNAKSFKLIESFKPTVSFFVRSKDRKTHRNTFKLSMNKVQDMSYTPDFIINYQDYTIILEAKGFPNERYPIVKKLFRRLLERKKNKTNIIFAEVKSVKEVKQLIEIINNEIFERNQLASR